MLENTLRGEHFVRIIGTLLKIACIIQLDKMHIC